MPGIFNSILETIGNTPIVRITKLAPEGVNLYAKVEAFNPMGSVKDRLALGVIEDAEKSGALKPGQTIVEATSGNTGIGLAMVCAAKGYPLVIVMAESFSIERRKLLRFLGAKVILTPASERGTGMVKKTEELAKKYGWFLTRQFENESNPNVHERTTGPEIIEAFEDDGLDYWVTGFGTAGTLVGVGRALRKSSPKTKIMVCEPDNSGILASGIPQKRLENGQHAESHPSARPHPMQGWAPDFVPYIAREIIEEGLIDKFLPIPGGDALHYARELAQREGIFVGITAGATFAGALQVAEKAPKGSNILCMLPDTGERYLSTPLFDGIVEEMNEEEREIAASTPTCRFDSPAPAAPAKKEAPVDPGDEARAFVEKTLSDTDQPVVLFALEWCEFCWAVRKMFKAYGIPFLSVDLDSAKNQKGDWGIKVRAAVTERTGVKTIPQIFIGGELIGGASEILAAQSSEYLPKKLEKLGVAYDRKVTIDPFSFLPKWVQKRSA